MINGIKFKVLKKKVYYNKNHYAIIFPKINIFLYRLTFEEALKVRKHLYSLGYKEDDFEYDIDYY